MDGKQLAKYIDHTILKPDATAAQVKKLCDEAKQYGFASVCVNPSRIALVAEALKGSGVTPCCVVGFPLGAIPTESKAAATAAAIPATPPPMTITSVSFTTGTSFSGILMFLSIIHPSPVSIS